jgi:3'-phosphoadenosine 5'-phosphosulfate sulfotransferase (PAPS reductase)/FAD synthetase
MYPKEFLKYKIYARSNTYKKRLERAKEVVEQALDLKIKWYIACSAGKDSVALAHLVNSFAKIPLWSEKDNWDYPEEIPYLEELQKKYGWQIDIDYQELSLKNQDICEDLHSRGTDFSDKFFYSLIEKQEKKFDGVFLGLRCEESIGRKKNYMKRGHIYQRKNTKFTCIPLATWKGEDIFAYFVSNEIPILPVYTKTMFVKSPTEIRKSWYLPSSRASSGHCVWLKYYYPDLFQKLVEIFPEVRNYV